jgi:hypothetical protein
VINKRSLDKSQIKKVFNEVLGAFLVAFFGCADDDVANKTAI